MKAHHPEQFDKFYEEICKWDLHDDILKAAAEN